MHFFFTWEEGCDNRIQWFLFASKECTKSLILVGKSQGAKQRVFCQKLCTSSSQHLTEKLLQTFPQSVIYGACSSFLSCPYKFLFVHKEFHQTNIQSCSIYKPCFLTQNSKRNVVGLNLWLNFHVVYAFVLLLFVVFSVFGWFWFYFLLVFNSPPSLIKGYWLFLKWQVYCSPAWRERTSFSLFSLPSHGGKALLCLPFWWKGRKRQQRPLFSAHPLGSSFCTCNQVSWAGSPTLTSHHTASVAPLSSEMGALPSPRTSQASCAATGPQGKAGVTQSQGCPTPPSSLTLWCGVAQLQCTL